MELPLSGKQAMYPASPLWPPKWSIKRQEASNCSHHNAYLEGCVSPSQNEPFSSTTERVGRTIQTATAQNTSRAMTTVENL